MITPVKNKKTIVNRRFTPSRHTLTLDQLRLIIARAMGMMGLMSKAEKKKKEILKDALSILTDQSKIPTKPTNKLLTNYISEWEKYYNVRKIPELAHQTLYKEADNYLKRKLRKVSESRYAYFFYKDSVADSVKKKELMLDEFAMPVIRFLTVHTLSIKNDEKAIRKLADILNYLPADLYRILKSSKFVKLGKHLTDTQSKKIEDMSKSGLFIDEKIQASTLDKKNNISKELDFYKTKGVIAGNNNERQGFFVHVKWPDNHIIEKAGKTLLYYPFLTDVISDARKICMPHIRLNEVITWEMLFEYVRNMGIIQAESKNYYPKDIIHLIDEIISKRGDFAKSPLTELPGTELESIWKKTEELMSEEQQLTHEGLNEILNHEEINRKSLLFDDTSKPDKEIELNDNLDDNIIEHLFYSDETTPRPDKNRTLSDTIIHSLKEYTRTTPEKLLQELFIKTKRGEKSILANYAFNKAFDIDRGTAVTLTNERYRTLDAKYERTETDKIWVKTKAGDMGYYVLAGLKSMDLPDKKSDIQPAQLAGKFKEQVKSFFSKNRDVLIDMVEEGGAAPYYTVYVQELIDVEHNLRNKDKVIVQLKEREPQEFTYLGLAKVAKEGKKSFHLALQYLDNEPDFIDLEDIAGIEKPVYSGFDENTPHQDEYIHPSDVEEVKAKLLKGDIVRLYRKTEEDETFSKLQQKGFTTILGDGSTGSKAVVFDLMPPPLDSVDVDEFIYIMINGFRIYDCSDINETKLPQDHSLMKQGYGGLFFYRETRLGMKEQVRIFEGSKLKGYISKVSELYLG